MFPQNNLQVSELKNSILIVDDLENLKNHILVDELNEKETILTQSVEEKFYDIYLSMAKMDIDIERLLKRIDTLENALENRIAGK